MSQEQTQNPNTVTLPSCIPKKAFARNEYGLICDPSVTYVYNDDGTINWRKMIKPEYLVASKQFFEKKGLPIPETVDGLEDNQVLILLGGIKELAQTRGYTSVRYDLHAPSESYVAAVCEITWIPNYETNNMSVIFSGIGDAHDGNTNGLGKNYLAPIAENRAFCRAVRNFLKIHIVSQEEVGGPTENTVEDVGTSLLRKTMDQFNISFPQIQNKLIQEKKDGAPNAVIDPEKMTSISDIPRFKQFELIERIKRKAAEKGLDNQG